jgi:hypothetical protein
MGSKTKRKGEKSKRKELSVRTWGWKPEMATKTNKEDTKYDIVVATAQPFVDRG